MIKTEEGVEAAQSEKVQEKEAGAGGERRRRPNEEEAGVADETQCFRAQVEAQVQAIQGMEHARVMSKELLQAKADVTKLLVDVAKLQAEVELKDEALQSKDMLLQAMTQSKEEQLKSNNALLLSKDAVIQSKLVWRMRRNVFGRKWKRRCRPFRGWSRRG